MDRLERWLGQWVVRNRWLVIVVSLLILCQIAWGMRYLTLNNDARVYFSKENPQLQALNALENTFTKDDSILFALAPKNGNVFTRQTLAAVEALTEAGWQIPFSSRVDSITNFQHTRTDGDELIVEDLVQDAASLSNADLERIKTISLTEPLLVNRLVAGSGKVTGVNINLILPGKSMNESPKAAAFARKILKEFRIKYPGLNFYLTGATMIDIAFGEAAMDDMTTLVPLMFLILLIVIGLAMRSVTGTLATLLIILFSMITGLGVAGWFRFSLTSASVSAPTVILTLAVADSIHLLITMYNQMRQSAAKFDAIAESVRINLQPVFLTSLTTTIGFLTMNFSDAPPFRDLGNIVAAGVMAAFFYSIFFLPAFMAVLPLRVKARPDEPVCVPCNRLADFVINKRRILFWGSIVVCIFITLGAFRIELDDDFIRYFDDRYDFRRASDFVEENLTGMHLIEYSLESGEPGGINNPKFLKTVDQFAAWYRQQPQVVHVNTLTDIIKRLNMNMHDNDAALRRIPEQQDLAAQYLLLYEMSLPFGLDLNNQINVDKSALRVTVTLANVTSKQLREMDAKAWQWLNDNAQPSMLTVGTGLSIMFAHISERNIKSMLGASFIALMVISGTLILALRSFKIGIFSLIPNLTPAFMAFGIWGFFIGRVGLAVSVIVAMTLGIVVDDTVHFMSKYLRARREHRMNPSDSVRYAFNMVGTALIVTTIALVAGFGVLTFSGFKVNADMGIMTAVTICLALALDFLFLPPLLMKLEGEKNEVAETGPGAHCIYDPADSDRSDT